MTKQVKTCDRCEAKIVRQSHSAPERLGFFRYINPGAELPEYESDDVLLCSMCLDDVWEFVFDADVDRSEKADPIPLGRVSENVERHIEDLETIITALEGHAGGDDD